MNFVSHTVGTFRRHFDSKFEFQINSRFVGILLYFAIGTNMITIIISESEI